MTSKLALYNGALRAVGQRRLATLTEVQESRYVLDDVYSEALNYMLEQGAWNFAIRSIEKQPEASITPTFGFANAFEKPSDWVRTCALSANEYFNPPLVEYLDERGYWWADTTPLYVRYVSNSTDYGLNLAAWPSTFTRYAELYLAFLICPTIQNSDTTTADAEKRMKRALTDARSKDAMNDPVAFPPQGSWTRSRMAGGASWRRYDRA